MSHTAELGIINPNFDSVHQLKRKGAERVEGTVREIKSVVSLQVGPQRIKRKLTVEIGRAHV